MPHKISNHYLLGCQCCSPECCHVSQFLSTTVILHCLLEAHREGFKKQKRKNWQIMEHKNWELVNTGKKTKKKS